MPPGITTSVNNRSMAVPLSMMSSAAEALEILRTSEEFDLLFTDVVMPGGVSGVSLAKTARELRPGLAVLLSSGFLRDGGGEDLEFPLLDKPYETAAMAARIRKLLDGGSGNPASAPGWAAAG
jgi:CheY-like chemotaxis protein